MAIFGSFIRPFFQQVNPFLNNPWFLCVCSTSLVNIVGKGVSAHIEQFLLFPQCFLPLGELSAIFIKFTLSSANSFSLEESKI